MFQLFLFHRPPSSFLLKASSFCFFVGGGGDWDPKAGFFFFVWGKHAPTGRSFSQEPLAALKRKLSAADWLGGELETYLLPTQAREGRGLGGTALLREGQRFPGGQAQGWVRFVALRLGI